MAKRVQFTCDEEFIIASQGKIVVFSCTPAFWRFPTANGVPRDLHENIWCRRSAYVVLLLAVKRATSPSVATRFVPRKRRRAEPQTGHGARSDLFEMVAVCGLEGFEK